MASGPLWPLGGEVTLGKRGSVTKAALGLCFSCAGQAQGANQPPEVGKVWRDGLGISSVGSTFPLDVRAGGWCRTRTEVQPGWEGSSHRPLLFRHEFLSWHSCP